MQDPYRQFLAKMYKSLSSWNKDYIKNAFLTAGIGIVLSCQGFKAAARYSNMDMGGRPE